jgi:hypothetical protein
VCLLRLNNSFSTEKPQSAHKAVDCKKKGATQMIETSQDSQRLFGLGSKSADEVVIVSNYG